MDADVDFAVFMATRNWPKVRAERFIESPRVTIRREYQNTTENNLLLIRAQTKASKKARRNDNASD